MLAGARLDLDPAPGGLILVQDLVNTSLLDPAMGLPDLLATVEDAQAWLDDALAAWARGDDEPPSPPAVTLAPADLPRLRALREAVRAVLLGREAAARAVADVELELRDGAVALSRDRRGLAGRRRARAHRAAARPAHRRARALPQLREPGVRGGVLRPDAQRQPRVA